MNRKRTAPRRVTLALGLLALTSAGALLALRTPADGRAEVVVYAATSLREALGELAVDCEAHLGVRLRLDSGASNDLARRLLAAGHADLFLSADEEQMARVRAAGLLEPGTERPFVSNRLVVVATPEAVRALSTPEDLARPEVRRLSLANPDAVPVGRYAKAYLVRRALWSALEEKALRAVDARAALAAVEAGAADAGIVYRTDVSRSSRARVAFEIPVAEHPPILYVGAVLRDRPNVAAARAVLDRLTGDDARTVWERFGFLPPAR
ncbi:MAG: molybdate ABC transporter substrate-binding protein [Planctomycetes bacterium]|nr:molybdate ABC transporter substrate-binding protein [Planctomycetota bacterium]